MPATMNTCHFITAHCSFGGKKKKTLKYAKIFPTTSKVFRPYLNFVQVLKGEQLFELSILGDLPCC